MADAILMRDRPILKVDDLQVGFGPRDARQVVVDGASFVVPVGATVGLVGESGSGKSVTSLAVMGLLGRVGGTIVGGSVEVDGIPVENPVGSKARTRAAASVGMIFQQPQRHLNPTITVGEQIAEVARIHLGMNRAEARRHSVEMLDMVEIPDAARRVDEYPHSFSGGMSQRVMIAMAMAAKPKLLIADEPTTALDVRVQAKILDLLNDMQRSSGLAILFVSHDLAVVNEMCEDVVVMYCGQVVERGRRDAVFGSPAHPYTAGLLASTTKTDSHGRLRSMRGAIPPIGEWPGGCRFFPRCEYAVAGRCDTAVPPLEPSAGQTDARCVRVDEIRLRGAWDEPA